MPSGTIRKMQRVCCLSARAAEQTSNNNFIQHEKTVPLVEIIDEEWVCLEVENKDLVPVPRQGVCNLFTVCVPGLSFAAL